MLFSGERNNRWVSMSASRKQPEERDIVLWRVVENVSDNITDPSGSPQLDHSGSDRSVTSYQSK